MKNYIKEAIIIGLAIVVGFAFFGGKTVIEQYGAAAGPDHYNQEYFFQGAVQGGEITTLTGTTSTSPTGAEVCKSAILVYGSSTAVSASTTLPTAASVISGCLPQLGSKWTTLFRNTASLATQTAYLSVSSTTATELLVSEASGADNIIEGGNSAWLTWLRTGAVTVIVTVEELVIGD